MPSIPGVVLAEEYQRLAAKGTPNDASDRSDSVRLNTPVPVFTPKPRTSWPGARRPSTSEQAQAEVWAAGIAGGRPTLRGLDSFDGGETTVVPSAYVAVIR